MPEPDRQPPHNLEAEEAVLGAILTTGRLLAGVSAVLEEADFYRPAHRAIWRAILRLAGRGEPTDPVTVLGELDDSGDLADVGGAPFLHTLVEAVPTVANAAHYAQLVADMARRRRVIDLGIRLAHSDADPAVLVHLAGELADTSSGLGDRWTPPIPFGMAGEVPTFPVDALPGWLGEYVAAVATATQTPPDLAGMLALAVLATVAGGAVEVQPRPGWREPLCLFVAVGMDAGTRKSSVFTALTRPLADFERDHAAAALPSITETITLRRIADQAAAHAEAAASKAPADQQEERQAEAIARAAEAANLIVPPVPRWLVDDATPEALAGLLATYGRIALLSPEGDVFDQMAGRYNQNAGPNLGVYLKGHAADLLKVDRRGRPPEYVQRPCLTIGLAVQPEVLHGLAGRPGFRGRGLLARFLYSLPQSLVGRRQPDAPPVPQAVADRYTLELQALAASLTIPASDDPTVLTLDPPAGELLLDLERDLETRLAADSGDLAHLAGWAAKLAGATCRLAALLHLASHLRDGWTQPINSNTLAGAIRLADYLIEHARAVFDLMSADPRVGDARWLLDWISRTGRTQFSRRDAHRAAPLGRFATATDLEPALRLLEEHGYLRRVDPEPSQDPRGRGRPASPRFLVNPSPRPAEMTQTPKQPPELFLSILSFLRRAAGVPNDGRSARRGGVRRGGHGRSCSSWAVTLSNENGPSRCWPCRHPPAGVSGGHKPAMADRRGTASLWSGPCARPRLAQHGRFTGGIPRRARGRSRRWARTMASVGIRRRVSARTGRVTYQVWWLLDDGSQGAQTVGTTAEARELEAEKQLEIARGAWQGRRRGRLTFDRWADEWWAVWSTDPDRSPTTLAATENRLRRHVRPWFGQRPLEAIRPTLIRQWQNQLAGQLGYESLMACRSILFRILQLAEDEGAVAANPIRRVPAPKRRVDPDRLFADAKRRALTPEEAGRMLARFPLFWWDHVLCLLGTGLRFGEFAGLRFRRVHLDRPIPVLQVVDTRYQAGRFGSGFKPRPKSDAGIREVPLAPLVVEAIRRQLPPDADGDAQVFAGPGGGNGVPFGTRTILSRHGFRRLYQNATHRARTDLAHLQLRGPHDLRHSFSTWLEDEGIPARVIDELMGHQRSRHGELEGGSRIGARYRHTTPEMATRVIQALDTRLTLALQVAEAITPAELGRSDRVF